MTNLEAATALHELYRCVSNEVNPALDNPKWVERAQTAIEMATAALEQQTTIAVYDEEELHHGCTVQVLRNSTTGECSVGRWKDEGPMDEWIGVEERMPDVNERVLACVSISGEPFVWDAVRWNGEEWETEEEAGWEYWAPIEFPVTHWMPLPEPPKEVQA